MAKVIFAINNGKSHFCHFCHYFHGKSMAKWQKCIYPFLPFLPILPIFTHFTHLTHFCHSCHSCKCGRHSQRDTRYWQGFLETPLPSNRTSLPGPCIYTIYIHYIYSVYTLRTSNAADIPNVTPAIGRVFWKHLSPRIAPHFPNFAPQTPPSNRHTPAIECGRWQNGKNG